MDINDDRAARRPTIASAAHALARLKAGERAWFWLRTGSPDQTLLALSPLDDDPGMTDLVARIRLTPTVGGTTECVGLLHVSAGGPLELGSTAVTADLLRIVAEFVRHQVADHPGLARLAHARFVAFDSAHTVVAIYEDDAAWAGIATPSASGTPDDAAPVLTALAPGASAWFWATPAGPEGTPFLAVAPHDTDPADFRRATQALVARSPEPPGAVVGLARRLASGTLVFVVDAEASRAALALSALSTRPKLAFLANSIVLDRGVGGFDGGARVQGPDFGRTAAAIASLGTATEPTWFWFSASDRRGLPRLIAGTDRDAVRAAGERSGGDGTPVAGQLILGADGAVEIHTRAPTPDLLRALARWASTYAPAWPALGRLRNARVMVRAAGGAIVDEHRDVAAWRDLPVGGA